MALDMSSASLPENRSSDDPLSAEHRRQLIAARDGAKVVRKTARVASFNGWTTAIAAALSLPFALFSPMGLAATLALALVAFNEFRGRKRLLDVDASGATLLGWNQLGLLALIVAYCLWMMRASAAEASAIAAEMNAIADLNSALASSGGFAGLMQLAVTGFYGLVIILTVLFQGGTSLYYFTRRRQIADYVAKTPEWIRDLQRTLPS